VADVRPREVPFRVRIGRMALTWPPHRDATGRIRSTHRRLGREPTGPCAHATAGMGRVAGPALTPGLCDRAHASVRARGRAAAADATERMRRSARGPGGGGSCDRAHRRPGAGTSGRPAGPTAMRPTAWILGCRRTSCGRCAYRRQSRFRVALASLVGNTGLRPHCSSVGASAHLVPGSRIVASMRPTIDPDAPGRGCHCSARDPGRTVRVPERTAPGVTWGVGHGSGSGPRRRGRSEAWISNPGHEPSNYGSSASRPGSDPAGLIRRTLAPRPHGRGAIDSPPARGPALRRGPQTPRLPLRRPPRRRPVRPFAADDPAPVEIGLDHAGGRDEVAIPRDRPGEPVDVRRLEGRDLAERMAAELPELDLERASRVEAGWRGGSEPMDPRPLRRARRLGRAGRLAVRTRSRSRRRGAGSALPSPPPAPLAAWLAGRRVARPERAGRIDPTGHGTRRPGAWRAAASVARRPRVGAGTRSRGRRPTGRPPDPLASLVGDSERLVRVVDLGHPARRRSRGGRIVAGQVRVVLACEAAPGGLDGGQARSRLDAEDVVGIPFGHRAQCTGGRSAPRPERLAICGI
jgi:hypothetical protein